MTFEEELNVAAVLAHLVAQANPLEGRLRVQKLMYLLQRAGVEELEPVFFQYHHYGPFSADVMDALNLSKRYQFVEEHEERDGDWRKYVYRPRPHVDRHLNRVTDASRATVDEVYSVCGSAHWRTLELAATSDFLRRADDLSWDQAFEAALLRKPACRPYESDGRELVRKLNLS